MINEPNIRQVAHKTRPVNFGFRYPLTDSEINLVDNFNPSNPPKVIDDPAALSQSIELFLSSIWKPSIRIPGGYKIHGKTEFVKKFANHKTGSVECLYSVTNPFSFLGRDVRAKYIRTPARRAPPSGMYSEISVYDKNQQSGEKILFVENSDILPKSKFAEEIVPPFLDYEKLRKTISKQFIFEVESPLFSISENFSIGNLDLLQISKVAGERFGNQNTGTVSCNLVSISKGIGSHELEVLDDFYQKITCSVNTSTFRMLDSVGVGHKSEFLKLLSEQNKNLVSTNYPDYYGGNVGFAMNRLDFKERQELAESIRSQDAKFCNDIVNPIGHIKIATKPYINSTLKANPALLYGSQYINLVARLLPTQVPVNIIERNSPSTLRLASSLNKYQEAIFRIGDKNVFPHLKLGEKDVKRAKTVQRKSAEEASEFINKNM